MAKLSTAHAAIDHTGIPGVGDSGAAHIADATDSHDASAISFDPSGLSEVTATEVQTAIEELDAAVGAGGATNLQSARYVRSAGDYTITGAGSTTFADVDGTNLNLTITTGARRVLIVLQASGSVNNAAGGIAIDVDLDGARLGGATGGLMFMNTPVSGEAMPVGFSYITDTLSAASHTFKLQWLQANTSHTATLRGSDPTLSFAVVELYA